MEIPPAELDEICEEWIRLLMLVLGWSRDPAAAWARDRISLADNPFFLHETTSWYILPLIITDEIRRRTHSMGELESRLDLALERFRMGLGSQASDKVPAEQVEAIRGEIHAIIDACTTPPEP